MTLTPAGLLLHESVLSSYAFKVFALVVALNTLIYLGLTMSKFVPWPRQLTPRRVRIMLGMEHVEQEMADVPIQRKSELTYEQTRQTAAVLSATAAFALLGILLVVIGLLSILIDLRTRTVVDVMTMVFGLVGLVCSVIFSRSRLHDATAIWVGVGVGIVFMVDQAWLLIIFQNPLGVAGMCVVLVLIPAVALSWLPGVFEVTIGGLVAAASTIKTSEVESIPSVAMIIGASLVGLILMDLRMSSIDEATSNRLLLFAHGTTDPTTGLLSRDALEALAPAVFEFAGELGRSVELVVVTVDDFVALDDDYGWDYGDEVIRTVGDCLDDLAPPGALRCRWSGSRVAMLAVGGGIDPDQLSEELVQQIRASGVALGKRPITVTCRVRGLTPEPGADLVQVAALMLESRPAEVESSGE